MADCTAIMKPPRNTWKRVKLYLTGQLKPDRTGQDRTGPELTTQCKISESLSSSSSSPTTAEEREREKERADGAWDDSPLRSSIKPQKKTPILSFFVNHIWIASILSPHNHDIALHNLMRRSNARTHGRKMDSIKLQFRQNSPRRSNLFSRNPKNATNTTKSDILVFALITVTLALFCYVFVPSIGYRNPTKQKFRIVIDGGSTGTRIHIFEYVISIGVLSFNFGEKGLGSMRVNPRLSSFTEDPKGAGGLLGELVQFGKKKVPKEYWGETENRLMATAGLRMLDLGVQVWILESSQKFLKDSKFKFQDD